MLTKFDWLRRCRSGTELLTTLRYFAENPTADPSQQEQGGPLSAIGRLCQRCYVYAPMQKQGRVSRYCQFCNNILNGRGEFIPRSKRAVVIWGHLNQISRFLRNIEASRFFYGIYIHDDHRFLAMLHRQYLKNWLQDLVIYSGLSLKGLLQIFPSLGEYRNLNLGDYLVWAIHHEATFLFDQLRIRFYTNPSQIINPKKREQEQLLTFELQDFVNMLEMVEVFRVHLYPKQQQELLELLNLSNPEEEQFYWGRFLGQISPEARDMLDAWQVRQWSKTQTKFFYHLINYVILPQSN